LHFPGDDAPLDIDVPTTASGAVHAVRTAHDLVVGPAVAVEIFPAPLFGGEYILDPAQDYGFLSTAR